jgi:hypothetical protein
MATILLAGVVCSAPKNSASGRHPRMTFRLRAESDGQVWLIEALDERELGIERLSVGDAVAITGQLDIRAEADREGRRRIGFRAIAEQIMFLRRRSIVKAALAHDLQPQAG